MRELWTMSNISIKDAQRFYDLRKSWLGEGANAVPPAQSQARADVCLMCPLNVIKPIQELFTGAVAMTVLRQIEYKNKLKLRVDGEKSLHVCDVCQCVLRLKTHVPIKFIAENTDADTLEKFPSYCWQKKEIEALK